MTDELILSDGDKLTPEEEAALGATQAEETQPDQDAQATTTDADADKATEPQEGDKATEAQAEQHTQQADKDPVQRRIDELTAKHKTEREKLELLKEDPGKFYSLYPDEKPASRQAAAPATRSGADGKVPSMSDLAGAIYHDPNHQHNGKTLDQIYRDDPLFAMDVYNSHVREITSKEHEQAERDAKIKADSEREINEFQAQLARDLYGRDVQSLTDTERSKVEAEIGATTKWMLETGRGGGILADAFYLRNRENDLARAKGAGAVDLVKKVASGQVERIRSDAAGAVQTGYEADIGSSADELAAKLDAMTDTQAMDWLKNAPEALKKKHPGLPW